MLHRRAIFVVAVALSAVLVVASTAGAHVTVQPGIGGEGQLLDLQLLGAERGAPTPTR